MTGPEAGSVTPSFEEISSRRGLIVSKKFSENRSLKFSLFKGSASIFFIAL